MERQEAAARVIAGYWEGWHAAFPALHKRGHWHIVHHLCTEARAGAPLGELLGLTRQALLVDDATVRDRVEELLADGSCTTDPPGAPLSARLILVPTPSLLARYDATSLALLTVLAEAAPALLAAPARPNFALLTPENRTLSLEALSVLSSAWSALLDTLCETLRLSPSRRLEARRHLLSTSHRTLLLIAIVQHGATADMGIQADRMAATLLERTGQNFQTTRDHIAALVALGVLERRTGRALTVGLAPAVVPYVAAALTELANQLAAIVRRAGTPAPGAYALRVQAPGEPPRRVDITTWPFTIGRTEGNALRLPAQDVSRTHCQLAVRGGDVLITDLGSTNGTTVDGQRVTDSVALADGAVISLGPFQLIFLAPDEASDFTVRHRA